MVELGNKLLSGLIPEIIPHLGDFNSESTPYAKAVRLIIAAKAKYLLHKKVVADATWKRQNTGQISSQLTKKVAVIPAKSEKTPARSAKNRIKVDGPPQNLPPGVTKLQFLKEEGKLVKLNPVIVNYWSITSRCTKCGLKDHRATNCPGRLHYDKEWVEYVNKKNMNVINYALPQPEKNSSGIYKDSRHRIQVYTQKGWVFAFVR